MTDTVLSKRFETYTLLVLVLTPTPARALGTIFVVLRCPLDRQEPALAPLHPDLDGPMPIHNERAPRLLSAIRAVAAPDVYRVTAHAVADRSAEASAGAYSRLHT
jgi:hypothetical protein